MKAQIEIVGRKRRKEIRFGESMEFVNLNKINNM
jgi:hypothetical protein